MNRYLVFSTFDGEPETPTIRTAAEIFNRMDMDDCTGEEITKLYLIREDGVQPCTFKGTWHDFDDPLKMTIETWEGITMDTGWGTDH